MNGGLKTRTIKKIHFPLLLACILLIAVSATNSLLGAKLLKKGALKRRIFQFLSAIIINATQVETFYFIFL